MSFEGLAFWLCIRNFLLCINFNRAILLNNWLRNQISDIEDVGFQILLLKFSRFSTRLLNIILKLIHGIWAIPAVLFIRLISPLVLVRVGSVLSTRIGHFVLDSVEQKLRLAQQPINCIDLLWLPDQTANNQWAKMVCRDLPVFQWAKYLDFWNRHLPGNSSPHFRPSSFTISRDINGLYYQSRDLGFLFTNDEDKEAKEWLISQGWEEGDPFVCVLVRDDAYLANDLMHDGGTSRSRKAWSYHDYRNSNIETYWPALEWLAAQGIWVLRMGKHMEHRLLSKHPRVIDYAFCSEKSDLLDIWLFANCTFCISTASGIDAVSHAYKRPLLFLNASPLTHLNSYNHSCWVPKHLVSSETSEKLKLRDYLKHNYLQSEKYQQSGIQLIDLSEAEILTYTQEFWQRLQETWQDSPTDIELHQRFWKIFESWEDYPKYHGWRHPESRVSTTWLRQQPEQFFE